MADRQKLSGAQNRKRKAEKKNEEKKQEGAFLKYICRQQSQDKNRNEMTPRKQVDCNLEEQMDRNSTTRNTEVPILTEFPHTNVEETIEETEVETIEETVEEPIEEIVLETIEDTEEILINETLEILESVNSSLDYSDPATWLNSHDLRSDRLRQILVEHGPEQIEEFDFPQNESHRKFSKNFYRRRLANGEEMRRHWLQYSKTTNSAFCFCCKIFNNNQRVIHLSDKGSSDWKNMSVILERHEKNKDHLINFQTWKELELRLKKNKTIDQDNLRLIKQEERHWQQVLERLIGLVKVLATQNIAFRGSNEKLYSPGNGNFLSFVEYLASFDPIMSEHLRRIKNNETQVHYLGKDIQNELIQLLSKSIQTKILKSISMAKYFSIILDCTPDVSHTEQMTLIIRFVHTNTENCDLDPICIREHFLGFVTLTDTTGAGMTDKIVQMLADMSLPIENLRGQGYDNGSNMKGKENGVQRRILNLNPRALFVPCSAHSLNLVVNDAVSCCLDATSFFMLVQRIYVYFAASTRRWEVLKRHASNLTVKPLSDTRWESRIDALKPLRYQLSKVIAALIDIFQDTSQTGVSGNTSRIEAQGLAKAISNFEFVVSVIIWYDILFNINITSKQLQSKEINIQDAIKLLEDTKKYLFNSRNDEGFERILVDARELAEESEISQIFKQTQRIRKQKKQFEYEANDEPIQNPKEKFKISFYFAVLDRALKSVEQRFTQMSTINSTFGFLYNIHNLQYISSKKILEDCLKLENFLRHDDSKDIDGTDLLNELIFIARHIPKNLLPEDVLNYICKNNIVDSVPNIFVALRILLTLPVSVASGERSFSKLKQIKTYIRSTMSQERLVGLAILSIEHEMARDIDTKLLLEDFAKLKARKIKF